MTLGLGGAVSVTGRAFGVEYQPRTVSVATITIPAVAKVMVLRSKSRIEV